MTDSARANATIILQLATVILLGLLLVKPVAPYSPATTASQCTEVGPLGEVLPTRNCDELIAFRLGSIESALECTNPGGVVGSLGTESCGDRILDRLGAMEEDSLCEGGIGGIKCDELLADLLRQLILEVSRR